MDIRPEAELAGDCEKLDSSRKLLIRYYITASPKYVNVFARVRKYISFMTPNHEDAARIFEAVSHPARIQVLTELSERDLMVFELVQLTGLQQSPLSQHLKRLRDLRLITSRRKGKNIQYSIVPGIAEKIVLFTLRNF